GSDRPTTCAAPSSSDRRALRRSPRPAPGPGSQRMSARARTGRPRGRHKRRRALQRLDRFFASQGPPGILFAKYGIACARGVRPERGSAAQQPFAQLPALLRRQIGEALPQLRPLLGRQRAEAAIDVDHPLALRGRKALERPEPLAQDGAAAVVERAPPLHALAQRGPLPRAHLEPALGERRELLLPLGG